MIAPSMLKCDFANLHREIALLESAGAPVLHLDVMDGHFVPNLSYGAMVIAPLRDLTPLPLDAHLMIAEPARYLDEYIEAGCDWITVHIETLDEPATVLRRIREAGRLAGISLNPGTPVEALAPVVGEVDLVLVMSVEPGFGGQKFQPQSLDRVRQVRDLFGQEVIISIDGGIGPKTAPAAAEAGAEVFVAGSAIFDSPSYEDAIAEMHQLATSSRR